MATLDSVVSYLQEKPTNFYLDDNNCWVYDNDQLIDENGNKVTIRIQNTLLQNLLDGATGGASNSVIGEHGQSIADNVAEQLTNVSTFSSSGFKIEYGFKEALTLVISTYASVWVAAATVNSLSDEQAAAVIELAPQFWTKPLRFIRYLRFAHAM